MTVERDEVRRSAGRPQDLRFHRLHALKVGSEGHPGVLQGCIRMPQCPEKSLWTSLKFPKIIPSEGDPDGIRDCGSLKGGFKSFNNVSFIPKQSWSVGLDGFWF